MMTRRRIFIGALCTVAMIAGATKSAHSQDVYVLGYGQPQVVVEIRVIIEERRVSPRQDFISDLVNARDAGDQLNDRELFDQIFGICGASLSATSRAAGSTPTTISASN
jgi:hypothetical protein